jgi:hypothetical protein
MQATAWAPAWELSTSTTIKYLQQATAASSPECSSSSATASRGRRKRSKHWPGHCRHAPRLSTCNKQLPLHLPSAHIPLRQRRESECSYPAATASRVRKQQPGHRPGQHDYARTIEATSNDLTSSKVHRRVRYLAFMHMRLVILTLPLLSPAEYSPSDAAASRNRRLKSKHRPERDDQVRATHSERRRGKRPGYHNKVPVTNKFRLICQVFFSSCDSVARPQTTV